MSNWSRSARPARSDRPSVVGRGHDAASERQTASPTCRARNAGSPISAKSAASSIGSTPATPGRESREAAGANRAREGTVGSVMEARLSHPGPDEPWTPTQECGGVHVPAAGRLDPVSYTHLTLPTIYSV